MLRQRRALVKAQRSATHDPEWRRLQHAADTRRRQVERSAAHQFTNSRQDLALLEKKLQAAQLAHERCISPRLANWLTRMRESSHNRRLWSLAWFTDDERFALVRKPSSTLQITKNTTHGYGLRHGLYDLDGKREAVYDFIGRMSKDNWIIVYKHIAATKKTPAATKASP